MFCPHQSKLNERADWLQMSVELQGYRLDVVQMRIWHVSNTGTVKMELQSPGNMEARKNQSGNKRHFRDAVLGRTGRSSRL